MLGNMTYPQQSGCTIFSGKFYLCFVYYGGIQSLILRRFERVSCAQITGFQNQANRENADWTLLASHPEAAKPRLGRWIWDHDPEEYANNKYNAARQSIVSGDAFTNTNIPPGYKYKPWSITELLRKAESGESIIFDGDWN